MAASGEPASAIADAASCGPDSGEERSAALPFTAEEFEETVESIEGLRGSIVRPALEATAVGEAGGVVVRTGADTLRGIPGRSITALCLASSLKASLFTALLSSSAGLFGTRFAGLGDLTAPVAVLGLVEEPLLISEEELMLPL